MDFTHSLDWIVSGNWSAVRLAHPRCDHGLVSYSAQAAAEPTQLGVWSGLGFALRYHDGCRVADLVRAKRRHWGAGDIPCSTRAEFSLEHPLFSSAEPRRRLVRSDPALDRDCGHDRGVLGDSAVG